MDTLWSWYKKKHPVIVLIHHKGTRYKNLHVLDYTFSVWQTCAHPHNEKELFIACCALIICRAQQVQKDWRSRTPKLVLAASCYPGQTFIIQAHNCSTSNLSSPQSINWINRSLLHFVRGISSRSWLELILHMRWFTDTSQFAGI